MDMMAAIATGMNSRNSCIISTLFSTLQYGKNPDRCITQLSSTVRLFFVITWYFSFFTTFVGYEGSFRKAKIFPSNPSPPYSIVESIRPFINNHKLLRRKAENCF